MQCKDFASVLEQEGLSPLPPVARDHLASCGDCQNFFADFSAIIALAHELPAEMEPPQRIWVSLRAQLEAEGLLKEPVEVTGRATSSRQDGWRAWFTPRMLATAGVGFLLAIAAFVQFQKPNTANITVNQGITMGHPVTGTSSPNTTLAGTSEVPTKVAPKKEVAAKASLPSQIPTAPRSGIKPAAEIGSPSPSEDMYLAMPAALNQAENELPQSGLASNPAVEASLRKNLRTVNQFIAECEKYLKRHPQDMLAREYLNSAYQQKADLIAALLDSGRSEQ